MLKNKGSTLIETLLAFEIFVSVIIGYVSLMSTSMSQQIRIEQNYSVLREKEKTLCKGEAEEIVQKVLH